MMHATAGESGGQGALGSILADEKGGFARMGEAFEAIGLGQNLAVLGARAGH
jgi:hypothetical protein